jgi:hypothetical protein
VHERQSLSDFKKKQATGKKCYGAGTNGTYIAIQKLAKLNNSSIMTPEHG